VKHRLLATIDGPDLRAIARLASAWPFFDGVPRLVSVGIGNGRRKPSLNWREEVIEAQEGSATFSALGVGEREACRVGIAAGL